jgi:hypothetical protein
MKTLIPVAAFFFCLAAFVSVSAQQGDPPARAPEYDPKIWKEYTLADDNVRFRFPIKPLEEERVSGPAKLPVHKFTNNPGSFLYLRIDVLSRPVDLSPDAGTYLKGIVEGLMNGLKGTEPKLVKNEDITVDGNAGRFVRIETNDGRVFRHKILIAGNKVYMAAAVVTKGKQHGVNWENDFEVPAMAFLDSIHFIVSKK